MIAIIGGSGAYNFIQTLSDKGWGEYLGAAAIETPFGRANLVHRLRKDTTDYLFLSRHGESGYSTAAPFVNYRANIWALKSVGVTQVLASAAVGIYRARELEARFSTGSRLAAGARRGQAPAKAAAPAPARARPKSRRVIGVFMDRPPAKQPGQTIHTLRAAYPERAKRVEESPEARQTTTRRRRRHPVQILRLRGPRRAAPLRMTSEGLRMTAKTKQFHP